MKIDRLYTPPPVTRKRRISLWLFVLTLVVLFLIGYLALNMFLMPTREVQPSVLTDTAPWDGYLVVDFSADPPHGPKLFQNLLVLSLSAAGVSIDGEKIQQMHQLIIHPRVHVFLQYDAATQTEHLLATLSLKRMSYVVKKTLNQVLPDIPEYEAPADGHADRQPMQSKPEFNRLQIKNQVFFSNYLPFLDALKQGRTFQAPLPDRNRSEDVVSAASFREQFEALQENGVVKGFVFNPNGRLKRLAEHLKDFDSDDLYFLVAEPFDTDDTGFWDDSQLVTFRGSVPDAGVMKWTVGVRMKNRLAAVKLEQFLKDRYFPRLLNMLEGRMISDVTVEREDYMVIVSFSVAFNYLKYVIDSAL